MRRRLVLALVAVATLAVALFAVPMAVQAGRLDLAQAELELERDATRAAGQVPADYRTSGDPVELPDAAGQRQLALYAPDGGRMVGTGPDRVDRATTEALRGQVGRTSDPTALVVAVPVSVDEQAIGAIRAAMPTALLHADTAATWGLMALVAVLALGIASAVGWRLAGALARPVTSFADAATRIGAGDFTTRVPTSEIPELADAAAALNETAVRLGNIVHRERTFTADASHQLNTPLTRARIELERAQATRASPAVERAIAEIDAMTRLVADLLDLARDTHPRAELVMISGVLAAADDRWHGSFAARSRPLRIDAAEGLTAAASPPAIDQILDVLLDNALRHGGGEVTVRAREVGPATAVDVRDAGPGIDPGTHDVFARRSAEADGHGIGLDLARALAEAEGGRLELSDPGPGPTFTLLLPRSPT